MLTLTEGDSVDVDVNIDPIDSTDPTLTWTSSDASVATVEDTENAGKAKTRSVKLTDTRRIHALKAGETTITVVPTVNAADGVAATFKVVVNAEDTPTPDVDKSKLEAAVDAANKLDESAYTADSWKAFAEVLASAEGVKTRMPRSPTWIPLLSCSPMRRASW